MNLKKGEIEINGILFNRDTNLDEVINNSQFNLFQNKNGVAIFTSSGINIEGYSFFATLYFVDKRLYKILLFPSFIEYEKGINRVCDLFIRKELGEPTNETEVMVFYEYDLFFIICFKGGHINIVYDYKRLPSRKELENGK